MVSTTDPDATWATKGGPAMMAYYDNYLIDPASRVIVEVEATPALFHQETVAARRMLQRVEKWGLRVESLGADKGYGSGEFLEWLLARGVQPHIRSLIVVIRPVGALPVTSFATNRRRTSTTVRKASHCAIVADIAARTALPIARQRRSATGVPRMRSPPSNRATTCRLPRG